MPSQMKIRDSVVDSTGFGRELHPVMRSYSLQSILCGLLFILPLSAKEPAQVSAQKSTLWYPDIMFGTEPLPPLPEGAFTIVVIPDTQSYTGLTGRNIDPSADPQGPTENAYMKAQIDWILENRESQNIVFVTHVGDIVDRNTPEQWAVAKGHLSRLFGVLPFGLTPGNHDIGKAGVSQLFQEAFPVSAFESYPWYLGCFRRESDPKDEASKFVSSGDANSAQEFHAGGIDFLNINLECNAPDDVLEWAGKTLEDHPNHLAIITTHMDLGVVEKTSSGKDRALGRMRWAKCHGKRGNTPEQMWDKLYRHHANLDFILSGDQSTVTAHRIESKADDGHVITALMSDYRWQPVLRLMRFQPDKGIVDVLSYHVVGKFLVNRSDKVEDPAQHRFTVPLRVKR